MASSLAVLAMPHLVAVAGIFPPRGGDGGQAIFTQGMIEPFAGEIHAYGAPQAREFVMSISRGHMLFALYQTHFGGDGRTTFALPNLEDRVVVGGSPVGQKARLSFTLTWLIASGESDLPFPGTIVAFGGDYVPDGWLAADGSVVPVSAHRALFEAIGTTYGGDGVKDFALPDLGGTAPVGVGRGPGLAPVALGEKVGGAVPGLGLNYLICTAGMYPPSDGEGELPYRDAFLGQVVAFAGARIPKGWALCDGALLPILDDAPLFSIIGNAYGGDGEKHFALPDLRGRMLAGKS